MPCHGNGPDHCCYVDGQVCPFLEENTQPGRRWTCGLLRALGDWALVHTDPRYLEQVKPAWERTGTKDCGDFGPEEKQCCWGYWSDPDKPLVVNVEVEGLGKPINPEAGEKV